MSEPTFLGKIRQLARPNCDLRPRVASDVALVNAGAEELRGARGVGQAPCDFAFDFHGLNLYDRHGRLRTVLVPIAIGEIGRDTWEPGRTAR